LKEPTFKKYQNLYYKFIPEGDFWEKMKPKKDKVALIIVDVQKGFLEEAKMIKEKHGHAYLYDRLVQVTIPNIKKLLDFFRENKLPVVHAVIGSYRTDGKDRSPVQSRPGWNYSLQIIGTSSQEEVDELRPLKDEIVVYKTTDSALNGTSLGHILRWMGIEHVVVTGIVTDQCVAGTVRDLADWGFIVYVVEDATAAISQEYHEMELRIINQIYAKVVSTEEIIEDLK
jgi:nicotinamidase-related amidase